MQFSKNSHFTNFTNLSLPWRHLEVYYLQFLHKISIHYSNLNIYIDTPHNIAESTAWVLSSATLTPPQMMSFPFPSDME